MRTNRDVAAEVIANVAESYGLPRSSIPELERRLEAHCTVPGSGRPPRGKYTTAMIVEWLTGDAAVAKSVARATKRRK